MSEPQAPTVPAPRPSVLRRLLRAIFFGTGALLLLALCLAVAAWWRSRTPLAPWPPSVPAGAIDEARYRAGERQFPGSDWEVADPARLGWSGDKLAALGEFARGLDTSSLMVIHRGVLIAAWGDIAVRENSQSMRKSLLSSLFGRQVAEGRLDLDATLAELGIDDHPPLTTAERRATVRQLLSARSGVYHSALYEAGSWKRRKPARGSSSPGEHWYYNNWDFNALATIYRRAAGTGLDEAFAHEIATPLAMQEFRPRDVRCITRRDAGERLQHNESDHTAYVFMISARDLARFGLLYLADGRWRDQQVLPDAWAQRSTFAAAQPTGMGNLEFGYMWWIEPPSEIIDAPRLITRGGRGHRMTIVPALDLVLVHRIPDGGIGLASQLFRRFVWHASVEDRDLDRILARVLDAMPPDSRGAVRSSAATTPPGDGETPPE